MIKFFKLEKHYINEIAEKEEINGKTTSDLFEYKNKEDHSQEKTTGWKSF